jgi:hypothetical protein
VNEEPKIILAHFDGLCFGGMGCDKEDSSLAAFSPLESWEESLTAQFPVDIPAIGIGFYNHDKEPGFIIFDVGDARQLWVQMIEELAKSGDPIAERLNDDVTDILENIKDEDEP